MLDNDQLRAMLHQQVQHTLAQARHDLRDFNLNELNMSPLALIAFHFLFKAIDGNENKKNEEAADDYLLILPDATLAEEALQGALLGALLGKYRANYIASDGRARCYADGDILLRPKQDGTYQWFRVTEVDGDGKIMSRVAAYGAGHKNTSYPGPVANTMRLLSMQQAKSFGMIADYPSFQTRTGLTTAISHIRRFIPEAPMASEYPHRVGVVCSSDMKRFVAETYPMPLRDWTTQNNPRMQLPLEPMAETARTYQYLVANVFSKGGVYNRVEELLVFDVRQYCDGNGKFANLLQGRNQGYYRNLVLVGSRAPFTPLGAVSHSFRRWEWTPEELALLLDQPFRYPQTERIEAAALAASHAATLAEWSDLEVRHGGLDLAPLRRLLPLLYRLVLPADDSETGEITRQAAGLRQWADALLTKKSIFSNALIYDPQQVKSLGQTIGGGLARVTEQLRKHNGKFEWLRALLLAATADPTATMVVLVVSHRDLKATETALQQALPPAAAQRLRIVSGTYLRRHLCDTTLNHDGAVWVLPSLRVGGRQEQELSTYRRLLLARATVKLLVYDEIEAQRLAQLEVLHHRLVAQALTHPDRAHFIPGIALVDWPSGCPAEEIKATGDSSPDSAIASGQSAAAMEVLNSVFGNPGDGQLLLDEASSSSQEGWDEEDDLISIPGQQCKLYFTDHTRYQAAYGGSVDVLLRLPNGAMLGKRRPATLLQGDEVLTLRFDGERLQAYLRKEQPDKFAAIDRAAIYWLQALRRLYDRYDHQATRLHTKLQEVGLRPRLATLEKWLHPQTRVRFPRAKSSLKAIAQLEQQVFPTSASLPERLNEVFKQRHCYNAVVKNEVFRNSLLLLDAYVSGEPDTARQALGNQLFEALRDSVQCRVLTRLELL